MAGATSDAALASIELSARSLRLPTVRQVASSLASDAERHQLTYLDYLSQVLCAELDDREERRRQRRVKAANFPRMKLLAEFDLAAAPLVKAATVAMLRSGSYLERGDPVVLLGDSGTGKSHLLIGLGVAACELGHSVRCVTCAQLVNELAEAAQQERLSRLVTRY